MRQVSFMLIGLFCIIWNNFNLFGIMTDKQYIPEEYVVIAEKITVDMAKKLSKRHRMVVFGETGGLADAVNILGLSFEIQGPLPKDKLRDILVDCVEEFLSTINANERLRPHLKNYPFTPKEIVIELFVIDKTNREVYDPCVSVASASGGKIWYKTVDPNDRFRYKSVTEEKYEDALKIVRKNQ